MKKLQKKKPSVLFLVQNLPVPFDRRVWMEATSLANSDYAVTVVCPTSKLHSSLYEELSGIKIIRYPMIREGREFAGMILEYLWSITCTFLIVAWLSVRRNIEVVHFSNPPDLLFLCALPAKLLRRSRLVYDQHDLCPELWKTKSPNGKSRPIIRLLAAAEKTSYRVADFVIVPNESYKSIALQRGRVISEKIEIIRSGPKMEFSIQEPKIVRNCNDRVRLVYLGTMGSQEGIEILLDAVRQLRLRNNEVDYKLDLIGDGPERVQLEQYSDNIGLSETCYFHGRISDSSLREFLKDADIAVNPDRPSIFNDLSSMNKIVEYMAFGIPIVQFSSQEGNFTARDAAVSVSESDSSALARAIEDIRIDFDKRKSMSRFGLIRFRELSWETQATKLIGVYERVLRFR